MITQVRDGKKVWPTCPECGCRLMEMPICNHLKHFRGKDFDRDAKGCKCPELLAGGSMYQNQVIFTNAGYNCE